MTSKRDLLTGLLRSQYIRAVYRDWDVIHLNLDRTEFHRCGVRDQMDEREVGGWGLEFRWDVMYLNRDCAEFHFFFRT